MATKAKKAVRSKREIAKADTGRIYYLLSQVKEPLSTACTKTFEWAFESIENPSVPALSKELVRAERAAKRLALAINCIKATLRQA